MVWVRIGAARRAAAAVCLALAAAGSGGAQAPYSPPPSDAQRKQNDETVWNALLPACVTQMKAAVDFQVSMMIARSDAEARFRRPIPGISWFRETMIREDREREAKRVAQVANEIYPAVRATASDAVFRVCMYDGRLKQIASGVMVEGRPTPAPPPGQMTVQQCTADITAKQTANMNAHRAGAGPQVDVDLYTYQVDLFRTRCAHHPEAAQFVSNGQRYLAEARARLGQTSVASAPPPVSAPAPPVSRPIPQALPDAPSQPSSSVTPLRPLATSTPSTQHNPAGEATDCVKLIGKPDFATYGVRSAVSDRGLINTCRRKVTITWCVEGADCNPGYSNLHTLQAAGDPSAFWPIILGAYTSKVFWAGCYNGFIDGVQGELSKARTHACK